MFCVLIEKTRGIVCLMAIVLLAGAVRAGAGDLALVCSTRGGDAYSDGTPVVDGECYALVHTVAGETFQGFTADGRALDPSRSYVALAAGLAVGGRCPPTLFQVLEANAASRPDGTWELFLLDTRGADGKPAGVDENGVLRRVNAWSRVKGKIRVKRGALTGSGTFEAVAEDTSAKRLAGGAGRVPVDVPRPRITAIRVVDGQVKLTVADTVPYLTYDVDGAAAPNDFGRRSRHMARQARDGRASGEITLEVAPADLAGADGARFFKIVRKSVQ